MKSWIALATADITTSALCFNYRSLKSSSILLNVYEAGSRLECSRGQKFMSMLMTESITVNESMTSEDGIKRNAFLISGWIEAYVAKAQKEQGAI
ncbi:hypothetical protein GOP47_0021581 [Adiantum capillus-veneris]|uniref:Uncharacterized protein n=1 Tax=Adiantum capillus-veneris TaxID=13818 RepID=A0A9D4U7P4_ADICA|nr:hypothetical protein GOP47_0021581 [Adiantum capillus-veneris]